MSNTGHVGEFATVVFKVCRQDDSLVATAERVEEFASAAGATAIGTQVESTLSVSDYGTTSTPVEELQQVEKVVGADRSWTFALTNATDTDWADLRVGIIFRDATGTIVGGGSNFPRWSLPEGLT